MCFQKELVECFISCKLPFFKEESEWRLFVYDVDMESTNCKVSFSDNDCKKYLEYNLSTLLNNTGLMDIRLGPKCQARMEDIQLFVSQRDAGCIVKHSEGTYR